MSVTTHTETQRYSPELLHIQAVASLFLRLYFQIFLYSSEVVTKIL
jgi:hypothetical protein